ncbi:MAG: methionine--tRNA ligase [Deltaproteobacteria bacterium]|nr:methionine--tRNA ligase [Deltaproteobacteria bacterium]
MGTGRHYFTTPLYYVNARPHIGHAYATVLVDVMTRYHRFFGDEVHFLTGTDEHGQKVMKAAENRGMTPIAHADDMSQQFRDLWPTLHIAYDDFIRTTEPRHQVIVQRFLQQLLDQGDIYEADYEGWYSPAAERFWTAEELVDGKCPDTGLDVYFLKERNYFFRMGKYAPALRRHLEDNPTFIQPEYRRNEVLGFLDKRVDDLCISRPKERLSWGIEIPFAREFVTYVWFDALTNYISALGGPDDPRYSTWWPHATHFIGKDILTTHAVYWSTMLMALGLPLPRHIVATGWWLAEDRKMSKSLGNVVDPLAMKDVYGPDVLRYYLMRDMVVGLDANFSEAALVRRNNSDLANDLGNLHRRAATLVARHFDGRVPDPGELSSGELELVREAEILRKRVPVLVRELALHSAIEVTIAFVRRLNKFITDTEPFRTVKTDPPAAARTLYVVLEGVRHAATLLMPIMPVKMAELIAALGVPQVKLLDDLAWGGLPPGTALVDIDGLFPRRDLPAAPEPAGDVAAKPAPAAKADKAGKGDKAADAGPQGAISYDDFMKTELVAGTVLSAEPVPGAEKLLRLEVDLGAEKRQVVSGIAKHYAPADLVGRQVVVVKNLAPRKIFKLDSHGMILAAETPEGGLALIAPSTAVAPGTRVS